MPHPSPPHPPSTSGRISTLCGTRRTPPCPARPSSPSGPATWAPAPVCAYPSASPRPPSQNKLLSRTNLIPEQGTRHSFLSRIELHLLFGQSHYCFNRYLTTKRGPFCKPGGGGRFEIRGLLRRRALLDAGLCMVGMTSSSPEQSTHNLFYTLISLMNGYHRSSFFLLFSQASRTPIPNPKNVYYPPQYTTDNILKALALSFPRPCESLTKC